MRPRREMDWYGPTFIGIGQMGQMAGEPETPEMAATLWVPDPEQRHGWREFYVRKPGAETPPGKLIGFRKPGS